MWLCVVAEDEESNGNMPGGSLVNAIKRSRLARDAQTWDFETSP